MSLDCPTCGRGDAYYEASRGTPCNDPWHGDAHLRRKTRINVEGPGPLEIGPETLRKAADVHNATTIRMRAETSRRCFENMLEHFVAKWAPDQERGYGRDRDDFQRDLMMLFRDAMEHKSMVYGMHIDRIETVLGQLSMAATGSVQAIFETEAQRQTREMRQRAFEIANQPKKET